MRILCESSKRADTNPDGFAGSGFFLRDKYVVSCYHVVKNELKQTNKKIKIGFPHLIGTLFYTERFIIRNSDEEKDIVIFELLEPLSHLYNGSIT